MRAVFLTLTGIGVGILALTGGMEQALCMAMAFAAAEIGTLFAADMYSIAAAMELDDARRGAYGNSMLLISGVFIAAMAALSFWRGARLIDFAIFAAMYVLVRAAFENVHMRGHRKAAGVMGIIMLCAVLSARFSRLIPAVCVLACAGVAGFALRKDAGETRGLGWKNGLSLAIFRAFPEALLMRGVDLIPAAALCLVGWHVWHVNTVLAYALGLAVFSALRIDTELRDADAERFGVRWLLGGMATVIAVLLGWNGVFSAIYCAWAVISALLPVQHGGKAWLCALLVGLQAACGYLGGCGAIGRFAAFGIAAVLLLAILLIQRRAVYAAWLPVRAWWIRRRAQG